jgi:hypothetical protein
MDFELEIEFGHEHTALVTVEAQSYHAALMLAIEPDAELRAKIEQVMRDNDINPETTGWHNYNVLG